MKVKLLASRAGVGWSQRFGEIVEMEPDEARGYIDAGLAEPVDKLPAGKDPPSAGDVAGQEQASETEDPASDAAAAAAAGEAPSEPHSKRKSRRKPRD